MKLLFVHERFGAFAGAEANILATAGGLKARNHSLGILHGPATGRSDAEWHAAFEHCVPFPQADQLPAISRALAAFNPDAIYVHKLADLNILKALLQSGLPLVRMVHDHDLYCMRSYKYNPLTRRICDRAASMYCVFPCGAFIGRDYDSRLTLKWVSHSSKLEEIRLNQKFDLLVVGSRFMREELLRNGFAPDKIEIHPPVPPAGEASAPSQFSDRNLIVYVGQIVRGKGVDVLMESLAKVRRPFECLVLGDGNHRAYCEKLSRKLGLSGRIHFQGYVPPAQLRYFYQEASLAVMSSVWPEPFGAAGLEAMRHGLPVVAFDAGGINEWLIDGYNGWLVPWMDRATFAERVEELLADKALARQMGEHGRTAAAEYFGFPKYLDGLEKTFARISAKNHSLVAA